MIHKIIEILKLPKLKIKFIDNDATGEVRDLYLYFNKRHPKYKVFKNKTIGVMLYKLPKEEQEYESRITGKNSVSYYTRRCKKMGYYTKKFKQSKYLKELYNINTSSTVRQGHKMSDMYLEEVKKEEEKAAVDYFGVFNKDNLLVGYIRLIKTPQLYVVSKLLGHKDYLNDNIMYLLLHDLTLELIKENKDNNIEQYFMYDTYFGGSAGIKLFKKRNCFKPYRVKWTYERQD